MKAEPVGRGDWAAIAEVLDLAFAPSKFESALVAGLRKSGREVLEWVLRTDGRIVAHVTFTKAYREHCASGFHLLPWRYIPVTSGKV